MTTAKLSPERRKEIAIKASHSRGVPRETHQGVLKILGKELPCAVLDDGRRIFTQTSVFKAFDRPRRGKRNKDIEQINIPSFLEAKNLRPFITREIEGRITPIEYLDKNKTLVAGYGAETIPIVCDIYLSAKKVGALTPDQERIADVSEILIKSLSRIGIIGLVDEATGYQMLRPRDALEAYLNKILGKELGVWMKRFPDQYYANIYAIRGWPEFSNSKNKYSCVGNYTKDIVYSRLGQDVLKELKERTPDTSKIKMHQWLSVDTGHPLLTEHLKGILILQKLAIKQGLGWKRFIDMVDEIYPKKEHALDLQDHLQTKG